MKKLLLLTSILVFVLGLSTVCFAVKEMFTKELKNIYIEFDVPTNGKDMIKKEDMKISEGAEITRVIWNTGTGKMQDGDRYKSRVEYNVIIYYKGKSGYKVTKNTHTEINGEGVFHENSSIDGTGSEWYTSKSYLIEATETPTRPSQATTATEIAATAPKELKNVYIEFDVPTNGKDMIKEEDMKISEGAEILRVSWDAGAEIMKDGDRYKSGVNYFLRIFYQGKNGYIVTKNTHTEINGEGVFHDHFRENEWLTGKGYLIEATDTPTRPSQAINTSHSTTDKVITSIVFEDYVYPTAGQELNAQDVKLKEGFPGKIESANYTMFQKTIAGKAEKGDNMALYIRVELDEGYTFSSEVNATLNGKTQDMRIHNDSMGDRLYGFVYYYVIPESQTIKITEQSPEIVEFKEGDKVELFVKVDGEASYQWTEVKQDTNAGGVKQKYDRSSNIEGATSDKYVIEKATKELDGHEYGCTITSKDGSELRATAMKLKLVEEAKSGETVIEEKSGDTKTETKSGDTKAEPVEKKPVEKVTWASASSWALDELSKANDAGLIPSIFNKENLTKNITRKEFAYIAVKFYETIREKEIVVTEITNPFKDTNDEYVLKAYKLGVTNGVSETEFAPDKEITREQLATMMCRAIEKINVDTTVDLTKVKEFTDDKDMHNWSRPSIYFMAEKGIIKGVDTKENRYGVTGNATREQALLISIRSAEAFTK